MRPTSIIATLLAAFALAAMPRSVAADRTPSAPVTLTAESFGSALARDLVAHFNLEGDLEVELPRNWSAPERSAITWHIDVSEYPAIASGTMLLRCRLLADGEQVTDQSLLVRASLWRDAWFARLPFSNGAIFDPTGLDTRRVDVLRDRDVVPATAGDRNFIFTRSVQAGRLLTWHDLGRRPLVRKGDLVEVTANEGLLALNMKALALQNGALGEAVTVRNMDSRKDFTAFVIDENHVQVRF
jgi:flagella basal body P-ring formation protein FlgA